MEFMDLKTRLNLTSNFLCSNVSNWDKVKVWDALQQMQRVISENGLSDQIDPILDAIRDDEWKHPDDD
tara:strand:- start:437 stop:640 length:204 start_codon:yes stop_codon:yes gene_type:complete